jgi:DNA primase
MNVNEKIEKIQKNFSIVDIVSPFSELFPKGKKGNQLIGICPICKSKKGFIISPQKNICKCFVCGIGGGPINFIMKLETLDFKEALNFIINKFSKTLLDEYSTTNYLIGNVYVLRLEDDCFYIGFSRNLDRRIKEHFSGNGSVWTKKHKPHKRYTG